MWSLEYEALAVAILDKVQTGLRASQSPIYVPSQRLTRLDALASLYACSLEGRQAQPYSCLPAHQRTSLSSLFTSTRLRKCFGWIPIHGHDLLHLNQRISFGGYRPEKGDLTPARFDPDKRYFGIVYEFIPPAPHDAAAMQRQIDFFHSAGFDAFQPVNEANWQGPGIKLDFGDFTTALNPRFDGDWCFQPPTSAASILGLHQNNLDRYDDPEYDPMAAFEEQEERERVPRARARAVERAYCARYNVGDRRQRHPSRVSAQLPSDTGEEEGNGVHAVVRVPEIEPAVVRAAWREYRREKRRYLAAVAGEEELKP